MTEYRYYQNRKLGCAILSLTEWRKCGYVKLTVDFVILAVLCTVYCVLCTVIDVV